MKLMTICGTRPELIRLSCFIREADKYFEHVFVHTGQNWDKGLKDVFFKEMRIRDPDYCLDVVGRNLGETIGNVISKTYDLIVEVKPDAVLILGDTNSGLSAISAKRLKIPVFHMEATQRCCDQNVPEELNRTIIDHISDVNLCYSENARRNLIAEGIRKDLSFVVGSPMQEVVQYYWDDILKSDILNRLGLERGKYIVLTMHRDENVDIDGNFEDIVDTLNEIARVFGFLIIFSCHPRTQLKLSAKNIRLNSNIQVMEPIGFFDYTYLEINSFVVISDSGSIAEMASILGYPAVSLRTSTERQEAIDKGNFILAGNLKSHHVINAINVVTKSFIYQHKTIPYDYMDNNTSLKVIKIIHGYTPVVNKLIWYKI